MYYYVDKINSGIERIFFTAEFPQTGLILSTALLPTMSPSSFCHRITQNRQSRHLLNNSPSPTGIIKNCLAWKAVKDRTNLVQTCLEVCSELELFITFWYIQSNSVCEWLNTTDFSTLRSGKTPSNYSRGQVEACQNIDNMKLKSIMQIINNYNKINFINI